MKSEREPAGKESGVPHREQQGWSEQTLGGERALCLGRTKEQYSVGAGELWL